MALGNIGKYEKLDVLGHGASGIVYLAWDSLLGKHVALKEISLQAAEEARFLDEARVLDRLRHPNIVCVNGVDKIDGHLIIDMEYVKGTNLQEWMRSNGKLPVREALSVAVQVSDALDFAHRNHTVHRDVKPANILISREGEAKIVDFGLAEILGSGSYAGGAGTYAYMAPEDFAEEERSDHRSDIWSVGVTLYEMLSGRRPFLPVKPKDPFSWKRTVEEDDPEPISAIDTAIPPQVEQVIAKSLAKNKHERYQSIGEMRDDLSKILASLGGPVLLNGSSVDLSPQSVPGIERVEVPAPGVEGLVVYPESVDFGTIRKGDLARRRLDIRVPGRGRTAGRVASQPGWLYVEPQSFSRRHQTLRLSADAESIWQPGDYDERLTLEIEGKSCSIPISLTVLPPRRQFIEVAWWYLPLLGFCLMPLMARWLGGNDDVHTAAIVASGLLAVMLLIVSWVADLGAMEKTLPALIGAVGLGAVVGTVIEVYSRGVMPDSGEILLISITGTPLSLLLALQLLTSSSWRVWAVITALCSVCVTGVLMGWVLVS